MNMPLDEAAETSHDDGFLEDVQQSMALRAPETLMECSAPEDDPELYLYFTVSTLPLQLPFFFPETFRTQR
jgi:hypothetical protein